MQNGRIPPPPTEEKEDHEVPKISSVGWIPTPRRVYDFLHFFSGRRREQDIQWSIEHNNPHGVRVFSIDIANDKIWGDLT